MKSSQTVICYHLLRPSKRYKLDDCFSSYNEDCFAKNRTMNTNARSCKNSGRRQSRSYKYGGSDQIDEVSRYDDNVESGNTHDSEGTTRPMGGKRSNALGLYDMSGNVWEFCSDYYGHGYYRQSPQNNPEGPSRGTPRVMHGGSWRNNGSCRVSIRRFSSPRSCGNINGFRLAR